MVLKRFAFRKAKARRSAELASIFLFLMAAMIYLLGFLRSPGTAQSTTAESKLIVAQASAMPNQGWLPLTVYFSAYGSQGDGTPIVMYEWDLDGNGKMDFDATSQGGYASYTYSKPGSYTITLQVTDAQGRLGIDQVIIDVRHPASSSVDYWTMFNDTKVQQIDVSLTQADWNLLWQIPEQKTQVQADAIIAGERLKEVGFRMRGQFSLRESGDKKPWKIDTDAYIDGQEYHNLRQLILLNNIGDPTLLKEKLAYQMMEFAGLPASHTAYVEFWIDLTDDAAPPVYWGIYTLVERVDNKYLANRFGRESKGGNLYKASHAQRGPMNLVYYGDNIEDYPTQNGQVAYGKMNNEAEADYSDIINLCRVVDGVQYDGEEAFTQALEEVFNVDAFLRYMAVITILNNWDSYPNTGNNYYLFNDPVSGKFQWIPWDLTWGENPQAPLFSKSGGELVGRAPLMDQVFQVARYRMQYKAYVDLLLRFWFTPENISKQAQKYHRLIAPSISKSTGDKAFYGEESMFPPEAFQNSWRELIDFAAERRAYLQEALVQEKYALYTPLFPQKRRMP